MPSNVALNAGSGGANAATKQRSHDGDTAQVQVVTLAGVTGSEDSYTFADIASGAGAESAALRVTLATESLAALETIELGATSLAALESLTTINAVTTVGTITNAVTVVGSAAEDAAASGNPVLVGGRYDSSSRTLETGDVGALAVNASGQLLVEIAAGAGSGGTSAADGATFTRNTTSITPVGAVVESSAPTLTNGDVAGLSQDTSGNLRVSVAAGGITGAVVDSVAGATDEGVLSVVVRDDALATLTPVDGDYTQMRTNARGALWVALDSTAAQTVTLAAGTATNEVVGDVAQDAAVAGNPLLVGGRASTATPTAMSDDGDSVYSWMTRNGAQVVAGDTVDDAAFTPGTSRVQAVGYHADETATDSVDEGDLGAARMTLDRKQIVTVQPHTAGGLTIFRSIDIDETEEEIKATAGQLYFVHAINMVATTRYLKFYNATAANVTVGTTTPVLTFPVPPNSTTGGGFVFNVPQGLAFGTAITVAATTGLADNDTGAPGANDVIINIGYA